MIKFFLLVWNVSRVYIFGWGVKRGFRFEFLSKSCELCVFLLEMEILYDYKKKKNKNIRNMDDFLVKLL